MAAVLGKGIVAKNAIARTATQIRTGHRRSAVYLKRIRKPGYLTDVCWFCSTSAKMSRSHVLLHCKNPKLVAARREAWEGKGRTPEVSGCC